MISSEKRTVRLPAFAKINLCLHVIGRRPDGYHELRTIFQTISLCDTLELSRIPPRNFSGDNGRNADGRALTTSCTAPLKRWGVRLGFAAASARDSKSEYPWRAASAAAQAMPQPR